MTALALQHEAVNLGQGFPDWAGPEWVKDAALQSIHSGNADQYPPMPGIPPLREAIADRYQRHLGRPIDPQTEVTVTCGCTEALTATFLGLINPGDEVILIEPYYDSYPAGVAFAGATPKFLTLRPPSFALDLDQLKQAFTDRTRAILINTPHNPTGHMFTHDELAAIAELCVEHDVIAISDEVYEEITFGPEHLRLATYPGMADRTVTLSSLGKTFSLTGWKVGWAVASPALTAGIRAAHQFITFTTPTPVQHGAVAALDADPAFYDELRKHYLGLRDHLGAGLGAIGFEVHQPDGTYFMLAGYSKLSDQTDQEFARRLVEQVGVAVIPPSVFYSRPDHGPGMLRFAFCKNPATIDEALHRLSNL